MKRRHVIEPAVGAAQRATRNENDAPVGDRHMRSFLVPACKYDAAVRAWYPAKLP